MAREGDIQFQRKHASLIKDIAHANVRAVDENAHTEMEHGERTWTTGQTIRDLWQNHADANDAILYRSLLDTLVDTDRLPNDYTRERIDNAIEKLGYALFIYKKYFSSRCSPLDKKKLAHEFTSSVKKLGEYLRPQPTPLAGLNNEALFDAIKVATSEIHPEPPLVEFRVLDTKQDGPGQWVSADQLTQPPYDEIVDGSGTLEQRFRYRINGIQMSDAGEGFDVKLTALYKSFKYGQRHQRGKFGEGSKMAALHLKRNNARLKYRSSYTYDSPTGMKRRIWQGHASGSDQLSIKGVEMESEEAGAEHSSGSYTRIAIGDASPLFQQEFLAEVDPRNETGGLYRNIIGTDDDDYEYSLVRVYRDRDQPTLAPIGVSLNRNPKHQFVQDIRLAKGGETIGTYGKSTAFSYNIVDQAAIIGRDRHSFFMPQDSLINEFWAEHPSKAAINALLDRTIWSNHNVLESTSVQGVIKELGVPTSDRYETALMAAELLTAKLDITTGNYLILSQNDSEDPLTGQLTSRAQAAGFHIRHVQRFVLDAHGAVDSYNNYLQQRGAQVYTISTLRQQPELLAKNAEGGEDSETGAVRELCTQAITELYTLFDSLGLSTNSIDPKIRFAHTGDPLSVDGVELEWNTGSLGLVVRPTLIAGQDIDQNRHYWIARIKTLALATMESSQNGSAAEALQRAQARAQSLLESSVHPNLPTRQSVSTQFEHVIVERTIDYSALALQERSRHLKERTDTWFRWIEAQNCGYSFEQYEQVAQRLSQESAQYGPLGKQIESLVSNRVILQTVNNQPTVGYFDMKYSAADSPVQYSFQTKPLDQCTIVGKTDDGVTIYQLGERIFMPFSIPEGSIITAPKHGYKLLKSHGEYFVFDITAGQSLRPARAHELSDFDAGVLKAEINSFKPQAACITGLKKRYADIIVMPPEKNSHQQMDKTDGVIDSPLDASYGEGHWDNPVRFMQDIFQNHLDAARAVHGQVSFFLEVERASEGRMYISTEQITPTDRIVGIIIGDNGKGYAPDNLGKLGSSSKVSPLFAGKYGEGQKMVSAAAARNGINALYSSCALHQGKLRRWMAEVIIKPDTVIHNGKATDIQKLAFALQSGAVDQIDPELAPLELLRSATILRLPDNPNDAAQSFFDSVCNTIDPRNSDNRGNTGIARYILDFQTVGKGQVERVGVAEVLLDQPGCVYENGCLVTTNANTVVGYNLPDITDGRERTSYYADRLLDYSATILKESTRQAVYDVVAQRLITLLGNMRANKSSFYTIDRVELRALESLTDDEDLPSKPAWDRVAQDLGQQYIVHGEGALRSMYAQNKLSANPTQQDRAIRALGMGRHIDKRRELQVDSAENYRTLSLFLMSSLDYADSIMTNSVDVVPSVTGQLKKIAGAGAQTILDLLDRWTAGPTTSSQYTGLLRGLPHRVSFTPNDRLESLSKQLKERCQKWITGENTVTVDASSQFTEGISHSEDHISVNERLLVPSKADALVATIIHELVHSIFKKTDYSEDFIQLLLTLAEEQQRSKIPQ